MGSSGFYTAAEAARIAKVPRSTLDYWARTRLIVPSQRATRPRLYSFADLRDLVVAQELRAQGAGVRDQRAALDFVRRTASISRLAQANFGVQYGKLIFADDKAQVVAPHRQGQAVYRIDMVANYKLLGMDPISGELRPAPRVLINPNVRGGTPVVQGTRIPTRLIAELAGDGFAIHEIRDFYPSLNTKDIEAALSWEEEAKEAV